MSRESRLCILGMSKRPLKPRGVMRESGPHRGDTGGSSMFTFWILQGHSFGKWCALFTHPSFSFGRHILILWVRSVSFSSPSDTLCGWFPSLLRSKTVGHVKYKEFSTINPHHRLENPHTLHATKGQKAFLEVRPQVRHDTCPTRLGTMWYIF
jgi:hypothetical protein